MVCGENASIAFSFCRSANTGGGGAIPSKGVSLSPLHLPSLRLGPSVGPGNRRLHLLLIAVESPGTHTYRGNEMIHRHRVVGILASLALLAGIAPAWAQTIGPEGMKGMEWRQIGPFRGGRVLAVTGVPATRTLSTW